MRENFTELINNQSITTNRCNKLEKASFLASFFLKNANSPVLWTSMKIGQILPSPENLHEKRNWRRQIEIKTEKTGVQAGRQTKAESGRNY